MSCNLVSKSEIPDSNLQLRHPVISNPLSNQLLLIHIDLTNLFSSNSTETSFINLKFAYFPFLVLAKIFI